jgi:hypothetical protein
LLSGDKYPRLDVGFDMKLKTKGTEKEEIIVHEFIGVKGFKAKGKRISSHAVKKIEFLEPLQIEELPQEISMEEPEEEKQEVIIPDEPSDAEMKNEKLIIRNDKGKRKNEEGEVKSEKLKVKGEKRKVKSEEVKEEVKEKVEEDGKREKGKVKRVKGKVKSEEETKPDKKDEDTGDAVQMELPL